MLTEFKSLYNDFEDKCSFVPKWLPSTVLRVLYHYYNRNVCIINNEPCT